MQNGKSLLHFHDVASSTKSIFNVQYSMFNESKNMRNTLVSLTRQLLLLLLLITAGAQGAWGEIIYGNIFYEQDYEKLGVVADWTTSVPSRFTPTIMTESTNHFLAGNPSQTYNNGATLTGPDINVAYTEKFVLSFDIRLRKSSENAQKPEFYITNYGGNKFFSLKAKDGINNNTWTLNNSTDITLDGTTYENSTTISDLNWFHFNIIWDGTNMSVEITNKSTDFSGSTTVLTKTNIERLHTGGGIGRMMFSSGRSLAKFAIDNIRVTSLFSFTSEEASIDITKVGMDNKPDMSSYLPSVINEAGATGLSYSSSDQSVAKIDGSGHIYLVGVGTTSIGVAGTNSDTYKSSYELTVYGDEANVSQSTAATGDNTTATWFLSTGGLVKENYDFGAVTLTTSFGSETAISVKDATDHYVVRVIDSEGSTATNTTGNTLHEDNTGGTFYRIDLSQGGNLQVWGTEGNTATLLNALTTSSTVAASSTDAGTGSSTWNNLSAGTYYLYNTSLHRVSHTYTTPTIEWSAHRTTVDIMDVGNSNPNVVSGLPTIKSGTPDTDKNNDGFIKGYKSSNTSVATFYSYDNPGKIHICGTGSTTITVIGTDTHETSYSLTVTGSSVNHTVTDDNTLTFTEEGVLPTGLQSVDLTTGLNIQYGFTGETSIVTTYNDMTVLKIIDGNGYSHPNLWYNAGDPPPVIPDESGYGGTFIKLTTTQAGYLMVTGNVSEERTVIYKYNTNRTDGILLTTVDIKDNMLTASLESGATYYLYNKMLDSDDASDIYIPLVHSISYVPGFFSNAYETASLTDVQNGTYTIQTPKGFTSPTYTITDTAGDVYDNEHAVGIDGANHLTNVAGGGAIRIKAEEGGNEAYYVLTVAYQATTYPGKVWDFNDGNSLHTTITAVPSPTTTNGDWQAKYKNSHYNRDPRWFYNKAVSGDNGFVIAKTAGLIFNTPSGGFFMRNDAEMWRHVGIFRTHSSFTIPQLKAGDIVELNWKRYSDDSGANFSATNVTDLRGKTVSTVFNMTGSRNRNVNGVETDLRGMTSFIVAADGDVTFRLEDNGYTDILSVRIYSGGYKPTLKDINQYDGNAGTAAPTSILLDNEKQSVTLNYSNPLSGTATGPAMYVLKGYRDGSDAEECVKGSNSQKSPTFYVDKDGYPISLTEMAELYEQRKNLQGFRMYNSTWQSANNSYNNGVIEATGGYGKVTVRLNNYTNDMQYVIGYTNDYTITFGSAPHQDYPFTWNFENISGGAVKSKNNNVYNSIQNDYLTWTNLGYETYKLDTNTPGGSLYVPGASLVTTDRSLGEKGTISELNTAGKGCDEFNGLGFAGNIVFKLAQQGETANDAPASVTGTTLLTYRMNDNAVDAAYLAQRTTEGDKTTWTSTKLAAGNGYITFGSPAKREESTVTHKKVYKMDGGNTKNVLLKPERAFKNGDHIILTGYSSANVEKSGFSFYANANDAAGSALLTLNWGSHGSTATANTESTIDYTVTRGDGLSGRSEVYLFRADKANTVYLSEVSITGDASAPVSYKRALTCDGAVTITIPDLRADDYVYIKSSTAPSPLPSNLTAAVTEDGLDATTNVYKYKVIAGGNANVTFADGTKIYRIGVTNIMKPLARVGNGDAWATESRDHAIDYTQTGAFTVNDIKANTVTAKNYGLQKLTVQLKEKTEAMPANTGLILKLKLKYTTDDETTNAVENLAKANSSGVPLFYPPYSATILSSAVVGFGGSEGNLMIANLNERELLYERETGVIDNDGDNIDDSGAANGDYTRFIFAQRYMQWKKENGVLSPTPTSFTESGVLPVFYRLHLYSDSEASALSPTSTTETLNTLGAYKAYMLIRSGNVPKALWDTSSSARAFIGIAGVSDMGEITGITEHSERPASAKSSAIYDLRGQRMGNDEKNLAPGIYIRNGKKFVKD